jgi:hypothetical protein
MTATNERARATFLLEVALDEQRVRERVAKTLRTYRDAQWPKLTQYDMTQRVNERMTERFPDMDEKKRSISYRQYQRWENAQSKPEWMFLETIAEFGGFDVSEFYARPDDEVDEPAAEESLDLRQVTEELVAAAVVLVDEAARLATVRERLEARLASPEEAPPAAERE